MPILSVDAVSNIIDGRRIVDNISFTQEQGEKIAIAGETASGKSCLLKMIGGHVMTSDGVIRFEGQQVYAPPEKLLPGHPGIVYLSQHFELRNNYYVHEMLSYANDLTEDESTRLYKVCQIEHLLNRKTNSGLSGGERQRIALAMLLASKPRLLLLDEPFSNLDIIHKQTIRQVVHDISLNYDCSVIMVSHDPLDILSWADTVMIMKDGQVIQKGSPMEVYQNPVNEYAGGLLGSYNLITSSQKNLYSAISNDTTDNRPIFIRPEAINIHKANELQNKAGLKAVVNSVQYFGIYSLVTIEIESAMLKVFSMHNDFSIGDEVIITIGNDAAWKIPDRISDWDL